MNILANKVFFYDFSRQNAMGLIVAMGKAPLFTAIGKLFWDDGESHGKQCLY